MLNNIQKQLFELEDAEYKHFQCKLMPTVDEKTVIGIRTPELRKLCKKIKKESYINEFLNELPHCYYEENNLHGLILCEFTDYDKTVYKLNRFLPFVDNWATCDLLSPKAFKNHPKKLPEQVKVWISSEHTYTVRFGVGMLLKFYLDEHFSPCYLEWVADIKHDDYYVKMMIAWYFSQALAKQPDDTMPYITEYKLPVWIHNKSIQKVIESYKFSDEQKEILKKLRIRESK